MNSAVETISQPVVNRLVTELVPYARNARTHSDTQVAQIAASIQEFGWTNPILVDGANGIIAGHGRLKAAIKLGMAAVPCIELAGLSEVQKRAYIIADNKLALNAGWDPGLLAAELKDLEAIAFDVSLVGFGATELTDLLGLGAEPAAPAAKLADRFLIAPFSVFNAREGWWQDRKRAWIGMGISSEIGRGANSLGFSPGVNGSMTGASYDAAKAAANPPNGESILKRTGTYAVAYKAQDALNAIQGQRETASLKGGLTLGTTLDPYRKAGQPISGTLAPGRNGRNTDGACADGTGAATGTSIFDPVLCEIAYRWFSPPGGLVLDPFAGGSVRGIVAAKLGRRYLGVDLREEQIAANREQWQAMAAVGLPVAPVLPADYTPELTPVEQRGQYWFKRDDLYCIGGVRGGKVRTCAGLAKGASGLVTAGSRQSPQANIVAHIAKALGVPARLHTPEGELSPELQAAREAGAEVIQHPAGYNNVIIARAREDAQALGWREIPFGMECQEAVEATASQVANIPAEVKRLVIPVGSGMSLAGVLHGLARAGRELPVLGVIVGADPKKRLDAYAPADWRERCKLVKSPLDYHDAAAQTTLEGIELDPIYEAKCARFLEPGDCFWLVGLRQTCDPSLRPQHNPPGEAPDWRTGDSRDLASICPGAQADLVFTCPPYADLEVYSDDPRDLSTLDYPAFCSAYREIIAAACALLKPDRFAAVVVGEVRDSKGNYYDFIGDTVQAFRDAGLEYYNEAILVTAVGSLPIRAGRQFASGRKLGKTHQNVLVFLKGDAKRAVAACGEVEVPDEAFADLMAG